MAERARASSAARELVCAHAPHDLDARGHGAPRATRPVLQLVRPPDGREADGLAADRRAADADPLVGRQRLARGRPEDRRRARPRALAPGARALRRDGLRLLLPARTSTGCCSTTCPTPGAAPCCYDTIVSESRIAALHRHRQGRGAASACTSASSARSRDSCDWSLDRDEARSASPARYYGTPVYDGSLPYNGTLVTPSWGGSMFEALMPPLFLPEERWAPGSWGANHPLTVRRADPPRPRRGRLRLLGLLAGQRPRGRLRRATASTASAARTDGYPSNNDRTLIDLGWPGCREPAADPPPSEYTNGVVTPHAAFLAPALRAARDAGQPARGSSATSTSTRAGASATRSTSTPAWCRTPTSRSTRA